VATKTILQMSANCSGVTVHRAAHCRPLPTPVSRPAKRSAGARTGDPSPKPVRATMTPSKGSDHPQAIDAAPVPPSMATCDSDKPESTAMVVRELRPKQVLAATLLVQGQQGKAVAKALNLSPETISRWRHRPEFQFLMRQLLQETIDATRLGIVSLCAESIEHLRGLVKSFNDETSLKAITLIMAKVGPVLGIVGTELRRASATGTQD